VKVLELAGGVMDELASPVGPRKDVVQNHCLEFMQLIKVLVSQKSIYCLVYTYILTVCLDLCAWTLDPLHSRSYCSFCVFPSICTSSLHTKEDSLVGSSPKMSTSLIKVVSFQ